MKYKTLSFSSAATLILAVIASSGSLVHAQTVAPAPTATPLFTFSGVIRSYYFGRTNGDTCLTCKTKGTPDATAFNFGGGFHGQINLPHTPFALGATYYGAYPFGANAPGPLNNIGYNPEIDNTVPGYSISVFGETYLQYKTAGTFAQMGKEMLTAAQSPWANSADTRIIPATYQGTFVSTDPLPDLSMGAMYMARWKSRVTSAFNANTLLTSCTTAYSTGKGSVQGVSGTFTVPGDLCGKQQTTSGFSQGSIGYVFGHSGLVANAYQYEIYDIASMTWLTTQYNFMKGSPYNPYVAAQVLAENNLGTSFAGTIHDYTTGGLVGTSLTHNLGLTFGYDGSPAIPYVVPSKDCKGTTSSPVAASPHVIFGGVPDTSTTGLPKGYVTCYGGGLASPYTDGYTSDPFYTTSLTQGMSEVTKPGKTAKATMIWLSTDRRLRLLASQAWYDYGLPGTIKGVGNQDSRAEFDFDVWFFLNTVRPGPYKGFSIRQRYGDRTQPFAPYEFKSSRTQLEYDF
jgi:hypothetical protein